MGPELQIVADKWALVSNAADWIENVLRSNASSSAEFSLVLAGGSTPAPIYEALVDRHRVNPMPWAHIAIYFGDERCVGPEERDSNYRVARETLLDPVGIRNFAAVHRMRGEADDAAEEASCYSELLPETLDLILLGMGEDGHTASLFPGQDSLLDTEHRVLAIEGPKPPPLRITLAPTTIVEAERVLVLASGAGKADAVARALNGPADPMSTPIQLARDAEAGRVRHWILDTAAAGQL